MMQLDIQVPTQVYDFMMHISEQISIYDLIVGMTIFFVFWIFKNLFTNYIFHFFLKLFCGDEENQVSFLVVLHNPMKNLIVFTGIYLALQNCLPITFDLLLVKFFRTGIIILFSNALYGLIGYYAENYMEIKWISCYEMDKILVPFLSKIAKFIVLSLAFVAVASTWGYDVNGFIAGLGLGGLAFALAAKDLLANIFSGIVIIIDKPFSIGDWVKTSEIEGTIEDINFRSTKIRTFDQALVTVPNANLVNSPIINYTNRSVRRITFRLKVRYDTPGRNLKECVKNIEKFLYMHPQVDKKTVFVKFDSFGECGLELFLYFFTNTIVWEEYLEIKQEINFKIMDIIQNAGISFALPSTSIYIEKSSGKLKNEKESASW